MPGAQHNVNPALAITWLVGVTIYCTFFNNNSPPPRQFLCNKILLKKLAAVREMLIQPYFELRGPWPPWVFMYSYDWFFSWQNNNLEGKSSSGLLFTTKILQEAMYFTSPFVGQITCKLNPKMQDVRRVLDVNCKQKRTEQLNFFKWLSSVKNFVLSNGFEYVRNVIQWC